MSTKRISDTKVIMTELVFPNDTNFHGNLMGGRLMYWMDTAAAMSAGKHCNMPAVTVSVDNISFEAPIKLGNVVHIEAQVSRAFNSSMEIHIMVWGEDLYDGALRRRQLRLVLAKKMKAEDATELKALFTK